MSLPNPLHPVHAQSLPNPVARPASEPGRRGLQLGYPSELSTRRLKWSPEEDTSIIKLRGSGMKWEDIEKCLPGRSAVSCRLRYQNYLERRSTWNEDKKNQLAHLYEGNDAIDTGKIRTIDSELIFNDRYKAEMWSKVAEEMGIPWRAVEAMHWQLGKRDMVNRVGAVPFSLFTRGK